MNALGPPPTDPLRVLIVCTGNLCRSPTAEQLLRARLDPHGRSLDIRSAGTMAPDGRPMEPNAAEWSRRLGGDPTSHRSVYLTRHTLEPVDLALGMARDHRRALVDLRPALTRSTFTFCEFARLIGEVSDAEIVAAVGPPDLLPPRRRLQAMLALLARARSRNLPTDLGVDDVHDPIGGPPEEFEASARRIDGAVDQIVRGLRLVFPG